MTNYYQNELCFIFSLTHTIQDSKKATKNIYALQVFRNTNAQHDENSETINIKAHRKAFRFYTMDTETDFGRD